MRVEAEDGAAAQLRRPLLHGADVQVAVLDRPGEVALLERCAHPRVLVRRHAAPEHQRLGAAADARPHGAHDHVVAPRLGQRHRPDLPAARRAQPERVRDSSIADHRRDAAVHIADMFARSSHHSALRNYAQTRLPDSRPVARPGAYRLRRIAFRSCSRTWSMRESRSSRSSCSAWR